MSARDKRATVVDLGLGNIESVLRALARAGGRPSLERDPEAVRRAERLVVPGQGGFAAGVDALAGGLGEALADTVRRGTPYLGICLGLQLLFEASEEAPGARGLALFDGEVRRFGSGLEDAHGHRLKVPHMGWNEVAGRHPLLPSLDWFYFVHSYRAVPDDDSIVVATADYGGPFCAAVARDALFACQFHPEKSHDAGARLLARFLAGGEGGWS